MCSACVASLPMVPSPMCTRCGKPGVNKGYCCQDWWALDGLRSPFLMEGLARNAIHHLKYRNLSVLAAPLAHLMACYLEAHPLFGEILVPVPLHPQRLRDRGYNQSALLARELGKFTGLPVEEHVLSRQRNSPAQAKALSVEERRQNVIGSFLCLSRRLDGSNVLLIDDVCTTGATLNACAAALKEAGAASVWGLTVTREI